MRRKNDSARRKPEARKQLDDRGIRRRYRELLGKPGLSDAKVDTLRRPLRLLAQAICARVWGKRVF